MNFSYRVSIFFIKVFTKAVGAKIEVQGIDNFDESIPTLFVANHFTRFETFIMPYILYSKNHQQVRSLADNSIFVGRLGAFLSRIGTVSTKDRYRNEKIIGDLISGKFNWIIYPEGAMIKNKKIAYKNNKYIMTTPYRNGAVHTGAAIIAMKSQLIKEKYRYYQSTNNIEGMRRIEKKYFLKSKNPLSYQSTQIVPINITYTSFYPLRNKLFNIIKSVTNIKSKRVQEEITIESNILRKAKICISYQKPINVSKYIYNTKVKYKQSHPNIDITKEILQLQRSDLTTMMMQSVYQNVIIHFGHIFALVLRYYPKSTITQNNFKKLVYLVTLYVKDFKKYRLHDNIYHNLLSIINEKESRLFDDALSVALKQNILDIQDNDLYYIRKATLQKTYDFHTIRLKNTFRVLLNEIALMDELKYKVKLYIVSIKDIKEELFYQLISKDKNDFLKDYIKYYWAKYSKPKEIGCPKLLYNKEFQMGIVLTHGFGASPTEVEELGDMLHSAGYNVYLTRIKGHGTTPQDLKNTKYQLWIESLDMAISILQQVNDKILLVGISTGGLLSLLASNKPNIVGVVSINSALYLNDLRTLFIPTLNKLNKILSFVDLEQNSFVNSPQNPHINYHLHYTSSINELKKLMYKCKKYLPNVSKPILIIQSNKDDVVNPKSAKKIYKKIKSKFKKLFYIDTKIHVITTTKEKEIIYKQIVEFVSKI